MLIQTTDHLVPHEVANILKTSKSVFNDYLSNRSLDPKVIQKDNFGTLTNELFLPEYKKDKRKIAGSAAKFLTKNDPKALNTERKQINDLFTKIIDEGHVDALDFIRTISDKNCSYLDSLEAIMLAETANFLSGDFDPKIGLLQPLLCESIICTFIKDIQHSYGIMISDESSKLLSIQFFNSYLKLKDTFIGRPLNDIFSVRDLFHDLQKGFQTLSENEKLSNDQKSEVLNEAIKYSQGINLIGLNEKIRKKTVVRPQKDPVVETEPTKATPSLKDVQSPKTITLTLNDRIFSLLERQYPKAKESDLKSISKELVHAKGNSKLSDDRYLYGLSMYAWPECIPEKCVLGKNILAFLNEHSREITKRKQPATC